MKMKILIRTVLIGMFYILVTLASNSSLTIPTQAQSSNLALNKPVNADSEESGQGNYISNGNDGNTSTRWCANDGNTGHWWSVDLEQNYNLTGSEVMWEFSGRVYEYIIEVSTNNTNWTTVVDKTNNTSTAQTQADNFTATARYVRITVTGLQASTWASFYEFRVFGSDGSTPTPTSTPTQPGPTSTPTSTPTPTPTSSGGGLPSPWQNQDVGAVGQAGDATYGSGTFTIDGGGADIWGTADEFHFVYQSLNGDGEIVARVVSLENTNSWAKAGVMIRSSLNANSTHAMMAVTASNGLAFQRRTSTGGSSTHTAGSSASAPYWVRLVRSGNTFTAYQSSNGSSWSQVGSATISMASNVYVGLAVTAHNDSTLATAQLDNVSVTSGGPTPTPTNTPVNTPTPTNTPVNTPTPTNTPVNTPTPTPTSQPGGGVIPQTNWSLHYVDSQELSGENGTATNAFDGNSSTIWHTEWESSSPPHPHEIQINLGGSYDVSGFRYLPRQTSTLNGTIAQYQFYVSTDGSNWGSAVATGTFANNNSEKEVTFVAKTGQYVRLVALSEVNGNPWTSAAEINVLSGGPTPTPPGPTATPTPTPTPTSPPSTGFAKGADVSHLLQLEDFGGTFYDDGVQKDLLQILKDHGVNAIRIKVWNDPGNPCCYPADQSDPAGYNNPAHVTQLAVRANNMGFRIMIDFHYSDWWADPGKQYTPHEWEGQSITQMRNSLYNFTYNTLNTLKNNGVTPEWVQVGNEISAGMVWPTGSTDNWNNLAALIQEGYNATKAVDPSIKVVLHYDNGGDNSGCVWWYDNAQSRGVQWDVIGLSYYPVWHGSFSALDSNIDDLAARYGKDVMVVETAYPWTTQNGDSQPNVYTSTGPVSYPMSPAGQRQFLDDLINRIKAVPNGRGKGFFYWEPEFIPVEGAGWRYGEGDEWDNVTLFDFNGNTLSSLDAYLNY